MALLGPGVELPGLQERQLDRLLGVEGRPAVFPKTDRMVARDVVVSVAAAAAAELVGLDV